MKRKIFLFVAIALVAGLGLAQLVPVKRTNPPVSQDVPAPEEVKTILRQACYDCHSHETVWPWYSHVAPASWLVADDVEEGREHLNFSVWDTYDQKRRAKKLKEVAEEVGEGEMPLWFYVPFHPDAKLDTQEKQVLVAWGKSGKRTSGRREGGREKKDDDD